MKKILDIRKREGEDMSSFSASLEKALSEAGLKKVGIVSQPRGPNTFPQICCFETSDGFDGGFIVDYDESRKVYDLRMKEVDVSIFPLGVRETLVQATYDHLRRFSEEKGYACYERRMRKV